MSNDTTFRNEIRVCFLKVSLAVLFFSGFGAMTASAADCTVAALSALGLPKMTFVTATVVPEAAPKPAYCDVKGSVATDGEGAGPNTAGFEAMLPENWNGKFVFNGVGGLAGSFNSSANAADRALFLERGYATAVTDTGHVSTDATWEYSSPGEPNMPKIVDYYYRAVHQVTLATKQLVKSYYKATAISHSYFDGCSNGGKMAMLEAMRYPDDYDGIIAGSPWLDPLGTSLWGLKNTKALLDGYIPRSLFPVVEAAIEKQCDALDGTADGLIQNPAKCSFDPQALVPSLLTQQQADALKLILKPVTNAKGQLIYPGSSDFGLSALGATNELDTPPTDPAGAKPWSGSAVPGNWNLAVSVISNLGLYNPATDLNNTIEKNGVVDAAMQKVLYDRLGPEIPTDPTKLKAYLAKGGKLLIYHGFSDLVISPYRSVWFYEDLAETNGGYDKIQGQARLFMVPGMQHCSNGTGPNVFDTLTALENWVEKGVAPDGIVASHSTNNVVDRTMPLCKFPEQARYKGSGDVNDAANWSCPSDDRSLLNVGPNGIQAGVGIPVHNGIRMSAKTSP